MTSLILPQKFHQVCRLCLSVVSDTNDLIKLSVFGAPSAQFKESVIVKRSKIHKKCHKIHRKSADLNDLDGGVHNNNNIDVDSGDCAEDNDDVTSNNGATDCAIDDCEDGCAGGGAVIVRNAPDESQLEILERIHTFLAISVSGFSCFQCAPQVESASFD